MAALFSKGFQDRVWLQRRQVYHQTLLDSQRFGARNGGAVEYQREAGGQGGAGFLGTVGGFLALVFFFFTIPAGILSALVALPMALMLLLAMRSLSGYWMHGYGELYRTTLIGIFGYLATTAVIGVGIAIMEESALVAWEQLSGGAILLHVPGVLVCATVLSSRIGGPLYGFIGFSKATIISVMMVSVSIVLVLVAVRALFGLHA